MTISLFEIIRSPKINNNFKEFPLKIIFINTFFSPFISHFFLPFTIKISIRLLHPLSSLISTSPTHSYTILLFPNSAYANIIVFISFHLDQNSDDLFHTPNFHFLTPYGIYFESNTQFTNLTLFHVTPRYVSRVR